MIEVFFSSNFKRVYKKRIAGNHEREMSFREKLARFTNEPFTPSLRTHKLSGDLAGLWSFRIEYDLRIIFQFTKDGKAVFLDLGTHNDVY